MNEELHIDCHICQKEMPYIPESVLMDKASFAYTTDSGLRVRTYLCMDCMKKMYAHVLEEKRKATEAQ